MGLPSLSSLVLKGANVLRGIDWDTNWTTLVTWLTGGTVDLNIAKLTASSITSGDITVSNGSTYSGSGANLTDVAPRAGEITSVTGPIVNFYNAPSSSPIPCTGTEWLNSTYPDLAFLCGTAFGSSGATSFKIPDTRDSWINAWPASAYLTMENVVDIVNMRVTITGHGIPYDVDQVYYCRLYDDGIGGALPTGLAEDTIYAVKAHDADTVEFYASQGVGTYGTLSPYGSLVTLTADGTGTNKLTLVIAQYIGTAGYFVIA